MRRLFVIACAAALLPVTAAAQSHTLVALSHEDHTAYEIDPATGQVVHKFTAQNQPHEGVASPDGRTYYLAVPNGPHVVVLDGQTFAQKAIVESPFFTSTKNKGSASPHGIAITDDGRRVYVGLENADVPGIVVIDTASNKVLKKIDVVLQGGHFLAIQPKTGKLYYPMREDHRVLVIDTATDAITKVIPIPGGPVGVGFAPNGEVWIHNDGDGTVHVIDSAKDEVVKVLQGLGKGAGRMAVSADGRWAASTHGGTQDVALIDAAHQGGGGDDPPRTRPRLPRLLARRIEALRDEFRRRRRRGDRHRREGRGGAPQGGRQPVRRRAAHDHGVEPAVRHRAALVALTLASANVACSPAPTAPAVAAAPIRGFTAAGAEAQRALETRFRALPTAAGVEQWHRYFTREPHPATSPRTKAIAEYIAEQWRAQGLEDVVIRRYDVLSSNPRRVRVEMVAPRRYVPTLREDPYPEDPDSAQPTISGAWTSFSASGDVTAPVVYANSGNPADYDVLRQNGIDPNGKIVIVRYSNPYSYRGFKALTAEREGAAAMIVYSDPAEDGYGKGEVFPQRSVGTGEPPPARRHRLRLHRAWRSADARLGVDRRRPADSGRRGRVDPEGHGAADVASRHPADPRGARRPAAPAAWKGGLPITYRLGGAARGCTCRSTCRPTCSPTTSSRAASGAASGPTNGSCSATTTTRGCSVASIRRAARRR